MTGIGYFEEHEDTLRDKHGAPNTNIITVSGLAGSGTTTIATFLADQLNLDKIDAGAFFRNLADEYEMDIQEFDAKTAEIEERENRDFDLEWDKQALEYAFTKDNFVLEGRLSGVLLADIAPVRIWVTCDTDTIAERIAGRENLSVADARDHITSRNENVLQRYKEKYGIDPRDDKYYNLTVDNSGDLDAVKDQLLSALRDTLPASTDITVPR